MLMNLLGGGDPRAYLIQILLSLPIVLLALCLHETAHGFVAYKLGDPTARNLGRLTLNPLKHLDPIGFICMLLFGFGWAKPVPVDPRYFKNPKKGMALTALAGPLSNLLCAFVSGAGIVLFLKFNANPIAEYMAGYSDDGAVLWYILLFLYNFLAINVSLAVFNLIPVPPLDGSKILFAFLPDRTVAAIYSIQRYFFIIIYGVIILLSRSGLLDIIDNFFIKICLFGNTLGELILNNLA